MQCSSSRTHPKAADIFGRQTTTTTKGHHHQSDERERHDVILNTTLLNQVQIEQAYPTLDQYVSGTTEKLEINLLYYHQSLQLISAVETGSITGVNMTKELIEALKSFKCEQKKKKI